ncbi:hypothetical protein [Hydrogenimonas sp.]
MRLEKSVSIHSGKAENGENTQEKGAEEDREEGGEQSGRQKTPEGEKSGQNAKESVENIDGKGIFEKESGKESGEKDGQKIGEIEKERNISSPTDGHSIVS